MMKQPKGTFEFGRRSPAVSLLISTLAVAAALAVSDTAQSQVVRDIGDAHLENAIVASVDGRPITLRDLRAYQAGRARLLPPEQRRTTQSILDALVSEIMFEAEFQRNGIYAQDVDVDNYIERLLAQNGSTEAQVREALKKMGLEWSDYYERMRREVERLALVNRVIRSRVNVTSEEVKRHWKESPEYMTPEQVEIADIFMPYNHDATTAEMEFVRRRVWEAYEKAKSNFGKAAEHYSAGPTADDGGLLGRFERGSMSLLFEREVAELKEGEISEPFQAEGAYHILKLRKIIPPGRVPLEEVEDQIREELYNANLEDRFRRWTTEDLRKRYHVTMHYDRVSGLL